MEQNRDVVVLDRNPDLRRIKGFKNRFDKVKEHFTFVQGDLSLLPHVLAVFDTHEPQAVYHLGAVLSAGAESNPTMGFQVDLVGTWHVLEAARLYCQRKETAPVPVLFPSTIASFGEFIPAGQKVPNEAVQVPTTIYGVAKISSERLGEYYHRKGWVDFRAVRFPSVIGAGRGPGGTTVYSTLMIQEPARGQTYQAYVREDTRLDILYVKDAVSALIGLHDADAKVLQRRVYNIAGIRVNGEAPRADEIKAAVKRAQPKAAEMITFKENPQLTHIVQSFGVLDDSRARAEWQWAGRYLDLDTAVKDFLQELDSYPERILSLDLYG